MDERTAERGKEAPPARIRPADKKIGEQEGNLRKRASWFRKRASGEGQ
jgi:hypothetical protein